MRAVSRLLVLSLLATTAFLATARDSVVIYRCTDASGAVSVQNDVPCPKGSEQQRRVMETVRASVTPPSASTPVAALITPPVVVVEDAAPSDTAKGEANPAAAEPDNDAPARIPIGPPPLFACSTWDRKGYFSDDPVPTRRCAPLRVSGLDGAAGGGGASACEWGTDTCAPVPDTALCKQWQQHAHDTRAMLLFGRADDPAATRGELERIEAIIEASSCGGRG